MHNQHQTHSRSCPSCGHPNTPTAATCVECGLTFPPTTHLVSDSLPNSLPTQITSIADQRQGIVSLYIQGRNLPVKVENTAHIIMGRRDTPDDTFVTLDLGSTHAHQLGVSRRHAVIHLNGKSVTVEDLGSSNGTYINDARLVSGQRYSLNSGDELRLGKLVILFVYYFPEG
ncbi:MAG: FHA domain-containing protein [Anaerolineae bacterium]|nr:FHA domain-containing protein [Anaerolineae bacterium]